MNRLFRNPGYRLAALAALVALPALAAAQLKPEAERGFEQYVGQVESRIQAETAPGGAFLWLDKLPPDQRKEAEARLRRGEVVISPRENSSSADSVATPDALILHWVGTILISRKSLAQVLATVQDYDRHQQYYRPEVVKSRTIERRGDDFKVYLRLKRTKVITVVFDTEHQVRYRQLDAARASSESRSIRIAELDSPGEAAERALSPEEDHGFLWRLNSYWRFKETPQGVYVQCEAVSLTRDIPTGLGWLVGRFVESIPKESLEFTLQSTRTAVLYGASSSARAGAQASARLAANHRQAQEAVHGN